MKHSDVLLVGDFKSPCGTSAVIAHDLRALRSTSYAVGLYQRDSAYLSRKTAWHKGIVVEARHSAVEMIPEDANAGAKIHLPVGARGRLNYDPLLVERHARRAFAGSWPSSATHDTPAGRAITSS